MGNPTYSLEVDLDGDGLYEAGDDLLPRARAGSVPRFSRGNDGARIISPPEAGTGEAVTDNQDGSLGPSSGLVKGRAIRLRETGGFDGTPRRLWAGVLDDPRLIRTRLDSVAVLSSLGNLSRLIGKKVSTRLYEDIRTDEALAALCDALGYPKNIAEYVLQDVAVAPVLYWMLDDAAGSATVADASGNGAAGTVGADVTLGNADGLDDEGRTNARSENTADSIISLASGNGMPTGASARSFMLRVRFGWTSGPANTAVFGYGNHAANQAFNVQRTEAFGDNSLYVWAFSNDVVLNLPAGANMSDGLEHTLIITLDDDGQTCRAYWDGVAGDEETFGAPLATVDGVLRLGQTTGAGAFAYFDRWAHFAVWDGYAVTAAEAAAIHSRFVQARRRFDEGRQTLRQWWLGGSNGPEEAFGAMLALKYTEGPGANIYEDGGGALVFKNRHAIVLESRSINSQAAFSDTAQPSPSDLQFADSQADVYNYAEIRTVRREAQASAVVWEFGDTLLLAPGETRVIPASSGRTTAPAFGGEGDPLKNAIAPTEGGGDYTVAAGSVASVTLDRDSGGIIPIRITAGPDGAEVEGLRLRAERMAVTSTTIAQSQVGGSIAPEDRSPWDKPIRPEIAFSDAQGMADAIAGWYSEGRPSALIEIRGDEAAKLTPQLGLDIQDRVTLEDAKTGTDIEAYVFHVEHFLDAGGALLVTRFFIEEALDNVYGVWDEGLWDVALWGW